jgi:uncharacterized membrane protein YfcA
VEWWLAYIAIGAVSGLLAGLLGVGGGIVVVPALALVFEAQGVSTRYIMPLALGTSLATIVFTSLASLRAHHARAAVDWSIVRRLTPGLVLGALTGGTLAAGSSSSVLAVIFAVFLWIAATHILLGMPSPRGGLSPGWVGWSVAGGAIGSVSGVVGIGGGTLTVPFLSWCRLQLPEAIGTAAAAGFPIALAGAVGYFANGPGLHDLPRYSAGFVYLPAVLGVGSASVVTAPLGARLVHRLPGRRLRQLFALFLYLVGWNLVHPLWVA